MHRNIGACLGILLFSSASCQNATAPNIVIILADDLGVNDVSWNNRRAPTPNLEKLANQGVILENFYTLPICTPSRAALLTGIYPFRYGFQNGFGSTAPEGLPTDLKLLPQQLKEKGYRTAGFGKWHLGFCSDEYTPEKRGFDLFSGLYVADVSEGQEEDRQKSRIRKNNRKRANSWSTSRYTDEAIDFIRDKKDQPFFVYLSLFTKVYPTEENRNSKKSTTEKRYEKIQEMDQQVFKLVNALKRMDRYKDTIIVFMSDNGARYDVEKQVYNYPLKGFKGTFYEGGTKVPGFVHSTLLDSSVTGSRYKGLMHMVDLYPTLAQLSNTEELKGLDGMNHWQHINGAQDSPRQDMIYNIDDSFLPTILSAEVKKRKFQIVVRDSRYKLLWGQINVVRKQVGKKKEFGLNFNEELLELYDLEKDVGEKRNIAAKQPDIVRRLKDFGLSKYNDIQPALFRGLLPNIKVLNAGSAHGGVTGWCRPIKNTTCVQGTNDSSGGRQDDSTTSNQRLTTIMFGTLFPDKPIICSSQFTKKY